MMKKTILLLLCLMAYTTICFSQNTVETIRKRYADAKAYIESHKDTEENLYDGATWPIYYHLEARMWLPGTGGHIEDIYFYYDEKEVDEDEEGEPVIYAPHYLTFVTTKYNFAAREYYEEYLFDEDGQLAFAYLYDPMWSEPEPEDVQAVSADTMVPDKEHEFRFYFNKGKLLRAIIKNRDDNKKPFSEVYSGTNLKDIYIGVQETAVEKANNYLQLFNDIDVSTYGN